MEARASARCRSVGDASTRADSARSGDLDAGWRQRAEGKKPTR